MIVFKKSYKLVMEIFDITKSFPRNEKFSLIDQIRRSSKAGPASISAAWVRRKYPKFFIRKLLDALEEETETEVWLDLSSGRKYIDDQLHNSLIERYK